jgi:hypothetical protein
MFATPTKQTQRVQAVLALLRGEPLKQVAERSRICRSDLYKFRRLAYAAIEQAVGFPGATEKFYTLSDPSWLPEGA